MISVVTLSACRPCRNWRRGLEEKRGFKQFQGERGSVNNCVREVLFSLVGQSVSRFFSGLDLAVCTILRRDGCCDDRDVRLGISTSLRERGGQRGREKESDNLGTRLSWPCGACASHLPLAPRFQCPSFQGRTAPHNTRENYSETRNVFVQKVAPSCCGLNSLRRRHKVGA